MSHHVTAVTIHVLMSITMAWHLPLARNTCGGLLTALTCVSAKVHGKHWQAAGRAERGGQSGPVKDHIVVACTGYQQLTKEINNVPRHMQVLLRAGAALELQDALGRSALMFAAGNCAHGALVTLLDAGAAIAARDRRGRWVSSWVSSWEGA
jgi:hypothetical protein